jgi:hypothetical protein
LIILASIEAIEEVTKVSELVGTVYIKDMTCCEEVVGNSNEPELPKAIPILEPNIGISHKYVSAFNYYTKICCYR